MLIKNGICTPRHIGNIEKHIGMKYETREDLNISDNQPIEPSNSLSNTQTFKRFNK
jgi:hypothetical protein